MSSRRDEASGTPPQSTPSHRRVALPAIRVDAVEATTLNLPVPAAGTIVSDPQPVFPSTPTPTLGGQDVRQNPNDGSAVVTFTTTTSADTGSLGLASPMEGLTPSGSATAPGQYSSSRAREIAFRTHHDFDEFREEVMVIADKRMLSPDHRTELEGIIRRVLRLDEVFRFLSSWRSPPRSAPSASSIWEYYIIESFHDLTSSSPVVANHLLDVIVVRSTTLVRRAWDDVLAPRLHPTSCSPGQNTTPSLAPPNARQQVGPSLRTTARPPSSIQASTFSDHSLGSLGAPAPPNNFYSHTNRAINSLDLAPSQSIPEADDTASGFRQEPQGQTRSARDRQPADRNTGRVIRISQDTLESNVAVINAQLNQIQVFEQGADRSNMKSGQMEIVKSTFTRLRDGMLAMVRSGSRSVSPSPTSTPNLGWSRSRRHLAPGGLVVRSEEHLPMYGPRSPAPWETTPFTPAPPGTTPIIHPSSSSGRYRVEGIVPRQPSPASRETATVPTEEMPRPAVHNNRPDISDVLPEMALSPEINVSELLLSGGSDEQIVDPNTWIAVFEEALGACVYSMVENGDPAAPSTSTAVLQLLINCTNSRHLDLGLPCVVPLAIPFHLELSELLRQLETSQATRVSQLMSIVARSFISRRRNADNLDAGATTSANNQEGEDTENAEPGPSAGGVKLEKGKERAV